jgi:hypothetical protein
MHFTSWAAFGLCTAILLLGLIPGPTLSGRPAAGRQGTPESSHRDVNLNWPKDLNQAPITPTAAL